MILNADGTCGFVLHDLCFVHRAAVSLHRTDSGLFKYSPLSVSSPYSGSGAVSPFQGLAPRHSGYLSSDSSQGRPPSELSSARVASRQSSDVTLPDDPASMLPFPKQQQSIQQLLQAPVHDAESHKAPARDEHV